LWHNSDIVPTISELVPKAEDLFDLEIPEVATILLLHLNSSGLGQHWNSPVSRVNFFARLWSPALVYPESFKERIEEKLLTAWVWLEAQALLIPAPGNHQPMWFIVSERGRKIATREEFKTYLRASMFPRDLLHPSISTSVYALFLRGLYETVIFEAFRQVEVEVRRAGGYSDEDFGAPLMRKAFHPKNGALTDPARVSGEQQGMSDLFAGAMGFLKNPTSHRVGTFDKPEEAIALVLFASYLLHTVDSIKRPWDRDPATGWSGPLC
jgi:uncharacterized protein (TIGR02391 family)